MALSFWLVSNLVLFTANQSNKTTDASNTKILLIDYPTTKILSIYLHSKFCI